MGSAGLALWLVMPIGREDDMKQFTSTYTGNVYKLAHTLRRSNQKKHEPEAQRLSCFVSWVSEGRGIPATLS